MIPHNLENMTRREFREARERGQFRLAIIPMGSIEQHLEHLTLQHDIASSLYLANAVASRLYPEVVVTPPLWMGTSEHHMRSPGTLSVKPGTLLSVVFDVVDSLFHHGFRKILLLNGHGGNRAPLAGAIEQWQLYFHQRDRNTDLRFTSHWDHVDSGSLAGKMKHPDIPGHAQEYETAFAMASFPEGVRLDALVQEEDASPAAATSELGAAILAQTIENLVSYVRRMLEADGPADRLENLFYSHR